MDLIEIAMLVFRIGVGVGAVLVGIGALLAALALRPVVRDLRSLAADVRRLSRLAEAELPELAEPGPPEPSSDRAALGPVQSAHATEDERIA